MSEPRLRAAIVGCGQIAGGYDEISPDEFVLTHAKAYVTHPATDLVAVADIDPDRAGRFAQRWSVPRFYSNVREMLADSRPDVVSICTPDETHAEYLRLCLEFSPRAVWCEKPVVTDSALGEELVGEYERRGISLAVNYHRRWDSVLQEIGDRLRASSGSTVRGSVIYGKGLVHSGSHALDLLLDWFGPVETVTALDAFCDFKPEDPTVSAWLRFRDAQVHLIGNDERNYTLWEIDLQAGKGRYRVTQAGLYVERYYVRADPVFANYSELDPTPVVRETNLHRVMQYALGNIVDAVHHGRPLRSTGRTALETLNVCERISRELRR